MALTPSTMLPLGTKAPDFSLPDTISNQSISLKKNHSNLATVIMFICNHCPYVKHIQHELVEVANRYQKKGIQFIAINSNDVVNYPEDSPANMKKMAEQLGFSFPYLFDETQTVAKAYQAACTPDLYVFDHDLKCVYRGQFDDSRPGNNKPVTGKDLSNALDAIIAGKPVNAEQLPSVGCNIKWK
ncbi:MAG: thioredoxin family protein [Gammaproteobacteria bacterium]|nr:thioredoxin family protein [Gammaproteobacteria bacterium]